MCVRVFLYVRVFVCAYVCASTCMFVCVCVCAFMCECVISFMFVWQRVYLASVFPHIYMQLQNNTKKGV